MVGLLAGNGGGGWPVVAGRQWPTGSGGEDSGWRG